MNKFYTITEYVDIDTGEMLKKNQYKENYRKIDIEIKFENKNEYNIKKCRIICERNRQIKFDF